MALCFSKFAFGTIQSGLKVRYLFRELQVRSDSSHDAIAIAGPKVSSADNALNLLQLLAK